MRQKQIQGIILILIISSFQVLSFNHRMKNKNEYIQDGNKIESNFKNVDEINNFGRENKNIDSNEPAVSNEWTNVRGAENEYKVKKQEQVDTYKNEEEFTNSPFSLISISTSTEVRTRQTVGRAQQAINLAVACVRSFFLEVPGPFCYKKNINTGIKPTLCDCGYFRVGDLCYENCEIGFIFKNGICWEECPIGWQDIGMTCISLENEIKQKSSKISYSKINSDPVAVCPYGYFKQDGLCYKDCKSLGLANCGLNSCAINEKQCKEGIINISLDVVLGMSSLVLFLFSFGASSNLPLGILKEVSAKSFILFKDRALTLLDYYKQVKASPLLTQNLIDRMNKRAGQVIVRGVSSIAVREVCTSVTQGLLTILSAGFQAAFNEEALDPDTMLTSIYECGADMNIVDNQKVCSTAIINYINLINVSGLAVIFSPFLPPTCEI